MLTTRGFYSIVKKEGAIHLRARRREDLERIPANYFGTYARPEILRRPGADYPFRILLTPNAWRVLAGRLAAEVTYPNFKTAAAAEMPERSGLLHRVWSALASLGCGLPAHQHVEPEQRPLYLEGDELEVPDDLPVSCYTCGEAARFEGEPQRCETCGDWITAYCGIGDTCGDCLDHLGDEEGRPAQPAEPKHPFALLAPEVKKLYEKGLIRAATEKPDIVVVPVPDWPEESPHTLLTFERKPA